VKRFRWLKVALGVGLLAFIASRVDPKELAQLLREGDPAQLALGFGLLYLANPVLQALRLHVLVSGYTQSLWVTFKIFFVSAFFNVMLPSNIGGDAIRLMYLRRLRAESWGGPVALLAMHRVTGLLVLLIAAGGCALLRLPHIAAVLRAAHVQTHLPWQVLAGGAACAAVGVVAWFALSAPIRVRAGAIIAKFLGECRQALREIGRANMALLLLLTAAFHAVRMLAFYVLVRYAGQHVDALDLLFVLAATALAGVVPITVGGLGLMEGAIGATLALFGVGPGAAFAVAAANRLVMLASSATGGLVYLRSRDTVPTAATADTSST
jgi:uncharacterized membrane protein YbhN (UPF0104 family)